MFEQHVIDNPPRSPVHARSDELDRLCDENRLLREVFTTATEEFARLRGQVRSLKDESARERRRADFFEAQCARLEKELEKSQARANKFASMLFAVKSEKLKVSDIEVGKDAVAVESAAEEVVREGTGAGPLPAEAQATPPVTPKEGERKRRGARQGHPGSGRKIPKNLPVEETRVEIPPENLACPVCGQPGIEKPGIEAVSYQVTVRKQYLLKTLFDLDAEDIGANGLQLETAPLATTPERRKIMNVDRYSAYKTLMRYGLVLLAYCWAHGRRDFIDITKKYPGNLVLCQWAETWLLKIATLYRINNKRVEHPNGSKLFLEYDTKLRAALEEMRKAVDGKHVHDAQVKVMNSMRNHWDGLTLFVEHPELPVDNNLMENDIRPCALGRNNFLGNHSRWGGNLAACMYSIVQTCLLNDIEPRAYLTYYFRECMARKEMDAETAGKLLPHKTNGRLKDKLRLKKN